MMSLTSCEQIMVRNMMLTKTNKQIATILELSIADVSDFVDQLTVGSQIKSKEERVNKPKTKAIRNAEYYAKSKETTIPFVRPPAVYTNTDWSKEYLD